MVDVADDGCSQLFYDGETRIIKRVDERFPDYKPKDIRVGCFLAV